MNKQKADDKIELKVMPYISFNRNLRFMFGAIPMMMYKLNKADTISPKSLSGMSAIYTTNKSYILAFFNRWYLAEDRWRLKLFFLSGTQNSQYYVDDVDDSGFYDYGTKMTMFSVGAQRKIVKGLYAGISYTYAHYNTVYEDTLTPPSTSHTNGLVLNMLFDSRDAVYYPTRGSKAILNWTTFPKGINDVKANKINTEYNRYLSMRKNNDVLALRVAAKFGLGDIAFEQQVTVGGKDIRGYSNGKYRGNGLMDVQAEYRLNLNRTLGFVGFGGLATIYGSDTESFDWKLYPGVGVGCRYNAFKKSKFNVGVDGALGKDDWGIYFRIGEAF